jgi:hypothetical protein
MNTKPETGRNTSFTRVLLTLAATFDHPINIVETGCIRNNTDECRFGDGWSTLNWEYHARETDSRVYVVDIDENHLNKAKIVVPPSDYVEYTKQDSVAYLSAFKEPIHLLFLDSYDYVGDAENVRRCQEHSVNELKAAWDMLADTCFVLIDDVFNDQFDGKGKLSIPYLLENGFELIHCEDSQAFLGRRGKTSDTL